MFCYPVFAGVVGLQTQNLLKECSLFTRFPSKGGAIETTGGQHLHIKNKR